MIIYKASNVPLQDSQLCYHGHIISRVGCKINSAKTNTNIIVIKYNIISKLFTQSSLFILFQKAYRLNDAPIACKGQDTSELVYMVVSTKRTVPLRPA